MLSLCELIFQYNLFNKLLFILGFWCICILHTLHPNVNNAHVIEGINKDTYMVSYNQLQYFEYPTEWVNIYNENNTSITVWR